MVLLQTGHSKLLIWLSGAIVSVYLSIGVQILDADPRLRGSILQAE
jgi:hypothetical protein